MNQITRARIIGNILSYLSGAILLLAASLPAWSSEVDIASKGIIPVENFFKNSKFSASKLSPDGKTVAMLAADSNDRVMLAVMNVNTLAPKILVRYSDADVGAFHWVNNKRLVYSLTDRKSGAGERYVGSGLFAIDIDGENERQLIAKHYNDDVSYMRVLSPLHAFHHVIHERDTDDIYVIELVPSDDNRADTYNLIRLNTRNGSTKGTRRPGDVFRWIVDQDGIPRVASTFADGKTITYLLRNEKWVKIFESESMDEDEVQPAFFAPDGSFYVTALVNQDTRALFQFDLNTNKIADTPLVSLSGYDYDGAPIFDHKAKKMLGIYFETDASSTIWFDSHYKKIQQKIDTLLPGKINWIDVAVDGESETVLVTSFSDVDPGTDLLFNTKTDKIQVLGKSRPWIKPEQMAEKNFIKYRARDGLEIPGYLTLPQGKSNNLPVVVLVHGGPYVRGEHWGWDPEAQFLASRGYAVLQPEFRGSKGYGLKHEKAGWKQWGLAMQDDVTDGTKWLIEKGIADPKRICIAGASYGGYATLWGLIKEHDLYQCGISWVGVSDLNMLYSVSWSDFDDDTLRYYLPKKVGDQKLDAAQLKATSPLEHASELTRPLILAYGAADRRVPLVHGTRFKDAARKNNNQIEWIVYPEEGHGWWKLKNNVDFWTRVDNFLNRNIGK